MAALAGAISKLKYFVASKHPMREFALPILCDFAHGTKLCKELLWKSYAHESFIDLLYDSNSYWQVLSLEALIAWYPLLMRITVI